jgi:hypothetical protein
MNKAQVFRQHHVTRLLRGAAAAGMKDPSVTVELKPTGATMTCTPGKTAPATAKPAKALAPSRSRRNP